MNDLYEFELEDETRRGPRRGARPAASARPRPRGAPPAAAARQYPVHDPRFVRWLQGALNRSRGLRLPLDGQLGPATRSALRTLLDKPADDAAADSSTEGVTDSTTEGADAPESEWQGEISRSSRDYIMWVQSSLNRLLGLRLAVDGISGPMTRAAVRDFQTRQRLGVDGIVGPLTEAALIRAGAGNPPGATAPSEPSVPGRSRVFPKSSDGTLLFDQGDAEWKYKLLGRDDTIGTAGCAITSMAMAISKVARRTVSPAQVDDWIDTHGGYGGEGGDAIQNWDTIAKVAGLGAQRLDGLDFTAIHRELDRGRPVVVGVDKDNDGDTDHWIALTRRSSEGGRTTYHANDPAGGRLIQLVLSGGLLAGTSNSYRSTGSYVILTGG